jgi:alanyl aminopeptidase
MTPAATVPELVAAAIKPKANWKSPALRLGDAARPTRYAARLKIIPKEETFTGTIDIELVLNQPLSILWLNGSELVVSEANLEGGGKSVRADPVPGGENFIGFAFESTVPAGNAKLHVQYTGRISSRDSRGIFRGKDGDQWYVASQFESIFARLAFPCFDEPSFKVPWQLTLQVPTEDSAFSNTAIVSEQEDGAGLKRVTFGETPPLPSYLIALAVGPYAVVDAGRGGMNQTPIRILTPKSRKGEARFAAEITAPILTQLESYFEIPYPYSKLDLLAAPNKKGAMENPGLVTSEQTLILATPEEEKLTFRQKWAPVEAHELAHMWFGDSVSFAWWDDAWLSEAFATWMSSRLVHRWKPEWHHRSREVLIRADALRADQLLSARGIRQPIVTQDDIVNTFDAITYKKGAAVLAMFEHWTGEARFKNGIQLYLQLHAGGNATAGDFLRALGEFAGLDLAPALSSFLDQPGLPLISVSLRCDRTAKPVLVLKQGRYVPYGAAGPPPQRWSIPVCARFGSGPKEGRACVLLKESESELPLVTSQGCPDWVLPNEGAFGYYQVQYEGNLLNRLLRTGLNKLTAPERIEVLENMFGLLGAGKLSAQDFLSHLSPFAKDSNNEVALATAQTLKSFRERLVPPPLYPAYARFVRRLMGERAKRLGWNRRRADNDDVQLERRALLPLVAIEGEEHRLQEEAVRLAKGWIAEPSTLDADLVLPVLQTAARRGDAHLFEAFHQAAKKTTELRARLQLLDALGWFSDQELATSALALVLSDEFDPRHSLQILKSLANHEETRALAYEFVKRNFDLLVERLPRDAGAQLPQMAQGFCETARLADVRSFFDGRSTAFRGGPRILNSTLETIELCSSLRALQGPAVAAFLSK